MSDFRARLQATLGGDYTLERELGAGGMATVSLAHDVKHDRKVAIKVLRPELVPAPTDATQHGGYIVITKLLSLLTLHHKQHMML